MPESRADSAIGSKWVAAEDGEEFLPGQRAEVIAAIKPLSPTRPDLVEKPCQGCRVPRHSVIRIVSAQLLVQLLVLVTDRQVSIISAPVVNAANRSSEAILGGFEFDDPVPIPGSCPVMGEAQEVKRSRTIVWRLLLALLCPSPLLHWDCGEA